MSLILDALKRAERERHAERSAALEDLSHGAPARPRRRWGRWLVLGVLVVVVGAVAVSIARRPKPTATQVVNKPAAPAPRPAPPSQTPPQAQPQVAPPVVTPTPAPAQPPTQQVIQARPAPAIVPGTEGVASLDDLTPESDVELVPAPSAPAPAQAAPPPELTTEPAEPAEASVADTEAEEPVEAEAPPPKTAAATQPAPRAIPPALTQKAPARKLREMPPDYRADFPALTVEVHVFEPRRRFVMINGRRYRDGERLAEGPQIVEIVRDGIVMDYRGERVLVPLTR
jgi:general secretion pathway protein B